MSLFRKSGRFKNVRTRDPGRLERIFLIIREKILSLGDILATWKKGKEGATPTESAGADKPKSGLKKKRIVFILAFLVAAGALIFLLMPEKDPPAEKPTAAESIPLPEEDATSVEATFDESSPEGGATETPSADAVSAREEVGGLLFQESPKLPMGVATYNALELSSRIEDAAVVGEGGTISQALEQLGITRARANSVVSILERENILPVVRPGAVVKAFFASPDKSEESLLRLEFYQDKQIRPFVLIPGGPEGFIHYSTGGRALELYEAAEGTVRTTFWNAGIDSGLDPKLVDSLADLLSSQIDFVSDVTRGDNFQLLFRARYEDGVLTGEPILELVQVTSRDKTIEFFRQELRGGEHDFFDERFRSIRKSFLVSPLQFTRISSGFSQARTHPILKTVRPHLGVDYAAPAGTPVSAVAAGKVKSAGYQGGFGLCVVIDHEDHELQTLYGHLSRIRRGVRPGAEIAQGEEIGYVGSTGLATGPHLDFRIKRENGGYVDPEEVFASQQGAELPADLKESFTRSATLRKERLTDLLAWSRF
ncbi:MAG: M23 family metallopeptidase [Deltaproteobacteria bacterium]|jgi:murein DD-endopeptidase MepM/ murein hydrolase activator NlpD|nr:M23 family metallopeptidase [Deltaproteobacteria bacterium]